MDDYVDEHRQAREADYIAFTGRHPFVTEAYERGYAVGFRQHTSGYQANTWWNVDLPVNFLDNDFREPDLDGLLELVDSYEPDTAVVGDAYSQFEAERYQQAADYITATYNSVEPIIVPKSRDAFDVIDEGTVVGWPNGYADVEPLNYSDLRQWRGRDVHILGGSPHEQHTVIDLLTQPTLDDQSPAEVVGLDSNSVFKAALYGEYWTPQGYEGADHLSLRDTLARSLAEIKRFWQDRGVWPDTEPIDLYGPAVQEPDEPLYAVNAKDITSREQLEDSIVAEYEAYGALAFQTETERQWFEYSEGLPDFWVR